MRAKTPVNDEDAFPVNFFPQSEIIGSKAAAHTYLNTPLSDKCMEQRLFAWFFALEILPQESSERLSSLNDNYRHYTELRKKYPSFEDQEPIVERDLKRSISMLDSLMKDIGIDVNYFTDSLVRYRRIFYILSRENSQPYLQGHDRFAYFATIVAASFCIPGGLNPDICESFIYSLLSQFGQKILYSRLILDPDDTEVYDTLEERLKDYEPIIAKKFADQRVQPQVYAMNWYLMLFTEQHSTKDSLLILDWIIDHVSNVDEYMHALCAAHLSQLPPADKAFDIIHEMLSFRSWDMLALFEYARQHLNEVTVVHEKKSISLLWTIIPSMLILSVLVYSIFHNQS